MTDLEDAKLETAIFSACSYWPDTDRTISRRVGYTSLPGRQRAEVLVFRSGWFDRRSGQVTNLGGLFVTCGSVTSTHVRVVNLPLSV